MVKILKNKIIIATIIVLLLISLVITLSLKGITINKFNNDIYNITYDSTWKVKSKSNSSIKLAHSNQGTLELNIRNLGNDYNSYSMEMLLDEVLYTIAKDNPKYNLLTKEKKNVTSKEYDGYEVLYENGDNQVLVTLGKNKDELFFIVYEASNKYFDILLDSVQNIIYKLELLDNKMVVNNSIKAIKGTDITFDNDTLNIDPNSLKQYELFSNHYHVTYEISDILKLFSFNTNFNNLNFYSSNGSIYVSTQIYSKNIYELLDEDGYIDSIKYIEENKNNTNLVKEVEAIKGNYSGYMNKVTYTYSSSSLGISYQKVYMIYSIDFLRTLVFEIEAKNVEISKDLIDSIKIISAERYGEHIYRNIENDKIINYMKTFVSGTNSSKYYNIKLYTPKKYIEQDYSSNKYSDRYFGLDYIEALDTYKYNVSYSLLSSGKVEDVVNMNNDRLDYKNSKEKLNYVKDIKVNNNLFKVYKGNYSKVINGKKEIYNETILINALGSNGTFTIIIKSKDVIKDNIISEVSFVDIATIDYND